MADHTQPGLLVLHGNRLELLAEAVFAWLDANPLAPLEPETILVQSNGMAEWFKMEMAGALGVCASTTVELPARFVWRAYRAVLGRSALPGHSPLDRLPLTWRLMGLLPQVVRQPGFEPVAGFLGAGDPARRLQLAQRLADLFDAYQVYRSDWLDDWSDGRDRIRRADAAGPPEPVPPEQRWQPALWRALLASLTPAERALTRAAVHRQFLQALQRPPGPPGPAFPDLPRRVVLFGTTHIPHQTLEAVAALAAHRPVLMAVPNPCRYHWADIIDGRELLRARRRRQALRNGRDLSAVALQDMHAHGHPLLAAWGRQGRDFVRQLDAFDDAQAARERFGVPRVDLFDEAPATTLLQQVQAAIRELLPLAEHAGPAARADDRSIVFHVAHSAQREVEILHDQLLHLLAHPPGGRALNPRDIVVMVPDIDVFAPAIRSVFGQHPRSDARAIPWGIADQRSRGRNPLLRALDWLLRLPHERMGASAVRDLLELPAVASRLGIRPQDMPTLVAWIEGAGVRWGLDQGHRERLGLGAGGEQNSWVFGLRRMLLGYATGELPGGQGFAGIEPYAEVAGLDAGQAGALAHLVRVLAAWLADATTPRAPADWAQRLRRLLDEVFSATDESDRALLAALDDALTAWLQACDAAGFVEPVDAAVVREAWLEAVDEPGLSRRFKAGGVTFCTLLPMRAIPFEVVCLLGMNDGDYPRRGSRSDFDLMAAPGQARPGDRSRRDDDRQLMLDALLSARRVLYVSWAGRSPRDNQAQPPSVLVSQLRDYLASGWGPEVLAQRTTEHPLQPFSRRYFEAAPDGAPGALFTYAGEWRVAHDPAAADRPAPPAASPAVAVDDGAAAGTLSIAALVAFLRNPVQAWFCHRLQVSFDELGVVDDDDECFVVDGLVRWSLLDEALHACRAWADARALPPPPESVPALLAQQLARLHRAGRLPMAGPGRRLQAELLQVLAPMAAAWRRALAERPQPRSRQPLRWVHPHDPRLALDDALVGLRAAGPHDGPAWIELQAGKVADPAHGRTAAAPRRHKLIGAWVRCLASAACGGPVEGLVIGEGAQVQVRPPDPAEARVTLAGLMQACREGLGGDRPLPTALRTGATWLAEPSSARRTYEGGHGSQAPGERADPCLARLFPDFDSLEADPGFDASSRRLYAPYLRWLQDHVTVTALGPEPAVQEAGHA